jgi:8-oxo-dGTP diphosphatase
MKTIRAVVGIIRNKNGEILIAERQTHQFKAGFWELSGGKIETGETSKQAIVRELSEELGIHITALSFFSSMVHDYADRRVALEIFTIEQYTNIPKGIEGQKIAWVTLQEIHCYKLLPTMNAIISRLILPSRYWITPAENHTSSTWMDKFNTQLSRGIQLIQLRSKTRLSADFVVKIYQKCQQQNVKLLLNLPHKTFTEVYCDGWHLTTKEMMALKKTPFVENKLFGVSAHTMAEAKCAQDIGASFVSISPVQYTQTHPNTPAIGWAVATEVVQALNIPVYFLGGMRLEDLAKSQQLGAQGIAGVSAF